MFFLEKLHTVNILGFVAISSLFCIFFFVLLWSFFVVVVVCLNNSLKM